MKLPQYLMICLLCSLLGCQTDQQQEANLLAIIDQIKAEFAPDKRVALFDIQLEKKGNKWLLSGETNLPLAKDQLLETLTKAGIDDQINLLPAASLGENIYAMVNNSVANLRSAPKHSAELATQATLGMPLKILKQDESGDFYLVQTPDKYIAWVDHGGIVSMNKTDWSRMEAAPKIIYLELFGFAYSEADRLSNPKADLVAGSMLELTGEQGDFYQVRFPDGREAFVSKPEANSYSEWVEKLAPSSVSLLATSHRFLGAPYLWGGTSAKGMDCSGFTKTVYLLHGLLLPRDASQQVHAGELVDEQKQWDQLAVGDLLFFGRAATADKKERVVHVGIWIGKGEFIHASGRVRIGSMDEKSPNYDEHNLNRYLRTKRILHTDLKEVSDLRERSMFAF